ncbi:MAG: metallophosphoesterase [Sedimentisphaerales bacterium]|nr:metallophosphoesterase [Sedimentisphaerales bacterium]
MRASEIITLAFFLLILAAVSILELRYIAVLVFRKLRRKRGKNFFRTKLAIFIHILAITGIICFLYGYFIEPYRIEVTVIPIRTDKLKHTSFRIVQISDLHCDKKPRNEKAVVELVNKLEPDVVVFTGDAVNTPETLPRFKDTLNSLKASVGKFAVYGNWETGHLVGLDYYSQTDFKLLEAETVVLDKSGEKISVSGLSYNKAKAADKMLQNLSEDCFNIFLYHSPDLVDVMDGYNVGLFLCGHTHGGQVALPFYGALITMSKCGKKYESGMYVVGEMKLYVNRGVGMDAFPGPPVRFLVRPEIAVFDIGPKN